ncbi:cyclophilin-like protein [Laetiporus sulphureus 93-53]|uniref:Peptidyl-prolyl isomerase CWC27 n=1 Tax=Laetiporus sulphureus 93-53 TaxID=1314785 RepID=A0A165EQ32_9APHY|nr:cyclophilin-like protein [Laetiporus sulphureus 93-53]KZT07530.1 cyclophilin-like protein [Laetiporus sulphureus 93-53]
MALPTHGRVIIDTTAGEIDVELWSKEAPKACRNFIALAMEGYYDGVIFHRIVPGFLVQTGDRTGTGAGGESFYGEPFEDEIHPRLRFSHRGLVAMANNGTKDSNDSQFFITLDRADELHGKHTLFGRVVGDTLYNVLKIGEMEIDENGRPLYPPKIKTVRIVDNPFDDIVPRITAEEKRTQQRAREKVQREREEEQRRRGAKKNVKLLSFGADETAEEEPVIIKKKPIVRPDLLEPEQPISIPAVIAPAKEKLSKSKATSSEPSAQPKKLSMKEKEDSEIIKIREKHAQEQAAQSNARKTEIEKMEAEIRRLARRGAESDEDEPSRKRQKKSYLEEEMGKYTKGRGVHKKGKRRDEGDVLAALNSFRSKIKSTAPELKPEVEQIPTDGEGAKGGAGVEPATGEEVGMEVDADTDFLAHALHFPKDNSEEVNKAERDYEVIDPRQRGARAREEERERKRAMKAKEGRRGYQRR